MKIHYISCHQVLEWNEVSLLTELGHEVFSNGAYLEPEGHPSLSRPGIPGAQYYPEYARLARQFPRTELPPELIEPFDLIIVMGGITDSILIENWPRIKHKKVVWRTIGQSTQSSERVMNELRKEGLKILRYSPKEHNIPDFCGEDACIRFHADQNELQGWVGSEKRAINITQSLKGRGNYCHYNHIMEMMTGFTSKVYGPGNDNLGNLNGGQLPWDLLKGVLRDNRVFVYGGTWPASYTLSFIDAMMLGIPIVSIGSKLAQEVGPEKFDFFEIPALIDHGVNGFISDDIGELRSYIGQLMTNFELAQRISKASRDRAIHLFGKEGRKKEWADFLKNL